MRVKVLGGSILGSPYLGNYEMEFRSRLLGSPLRNVIRCSEFKPPITAVQEQGPPPEMKVMQGLGFKGLGFFRLCSPP